MEKDKLFTLVGRYQYSSEAIIYKTKLESEGIEVFTRDINTIDNYPLYSNLLGGVKLFVKSEDEIIAKKILAQISPFSLDENQELIKCPNCGEKQIQMEISIKDLKSLLSYIVSLIFIVFPFHTRYKYKCQNCNYQF